MSPTGEKYFVIVVHQQSTVVSFEVKDKGYENWVIVLPAPQWILDIQGEVIKAITEQTDKNESFIL